MRPIGVTGSAREPGRHDRLWSGCDDHRIFRGDALVEVVSALGLEAERRAP